MNELMIELQNYLTDNFISFKTIKNKPNVLLINGESYELFSVNEDGRFFDESFHWDNDRTEEDYYIFCFGSVWYSLKKGNENSVKLERVKWLGSANIDESLKQENFLGIHGQFELMNGMGEYKDWCRKAKWLGVKTLGICERGTLAGALKFQTACQKAEIRSIIGMEVPIQDPNSDSRYSVKVFVKDELGWKNLLWLNKIINVDGEGFVSEKDLKEYSEGLIIIYDPKTTDFNILPSEVWLNSKSYYQLDTVVYKKEERDETYLKNLKRFFNTKMEPVLMSDAYYLEKEHSAIRSKLNRLSGAMNYESENQYFKNGEELWTEMNSLFSENHFERSFETFVKACENLNNICNDCNFTIETSQRHLPKYHMTPEEEKLYSSNTEMFRELVYEGVEAHPDLLEDFGFDAVAERIEREIDVIEDGGVVDYFLILRDITNWCKKEGILLGAGRGCFLPGQKVLLKDGSQKNIEDVQIGDQLQTYWSEENPVINKFEYDCCEEIVELEFETGRKIRCTKDHEFYTSNRGWVKADDLLETDDCPFIKHSTCKDIVEKTKLLEKTYINYSGKVYDLQVDNRHHSYTVEGLVVHNSAGGSICTYLLGITGVNPLRYSLLFERFINAGRLVRTEEKEIIVINEDNQPIELDSSKYYRIFRNNKRIIARGSEIKIGDVLIDYES